MDLTDILIRVAATEEVPSIRQGMPWYVAVRTNLIARALERAGFKAGLVGKEIVYTRPHNKEAKLLIRVYTSIKQGYETVKPKGKDAIRIVLLYKDDKATYGVTKAMKVLRTGKEEDVVKRTLNRARSMYAFANEMLKVPRCSICGAPVYADSKKCPAYKGHPQ